MNLRLRSRLVNMGWYCMKLIIFVHMIMYRYLNKTYRIFKYIKKQLLKSSNIYIVYNECIETLTELPDISRSYEYLVYKKEPDMKDNLNKTLMRLFQGDIEKINYDINNSWNICKFKFISVLIKTDNNVYDITHLLNNDNHYYYIIGAELFNKNFIDWIGRYYLRTDLKNSTIEFMDNCINEVTIKASQYIILNENNYEIKESLLNYNKQYKKL